jgi:hypothetical protein
MLNPKQIASMQPPVVGQISFSESTGNYWLVTETANQTATVTRLAYEYEGRVYRVNKVRLDAHNWNVETFRNDDLRVVGTNPTRFNSWLNRVTK